MSLYFGELKFLLKGGIFTAVFSDLLPPLFSADEVKLVSLLFSLLLQGSQFSAPSRDLAFETKPARAPSHSLRCLI